MLAELHTEKMITSRRNGWIVKKQWLVMNERLCLGDLPTSGWVEYEVLVDEQLDDNSLSRTTRHFQSIQSNAGTLIGPDWGNTEGVSPIPPSVTSFSYGRIREIHTQRG